jgi:DNA-binding NarL/FixJ family response regulator
MTKGIGILLVDDHSLFREGLSRLLEAEPGFHIAGNCASATEALAVLDREPVDIVLLDYDLGDEQGSLFLENAKRKGFEGRVLMVTAGMSDAGTLRAFELGASGIFLKHSPPSELVQAIYQVMNGDPWLDPRAMRSVVAGATDKAGGSASATLNQRERAVLRAVFEGLSNKEIAEKLQISEYSVKWVLQQLFDKTGVRTRSQLVRIALEKFSHDWLMAESES